jgi:hypothetical protein
MIQLLGMVGVTADWANGCMETVHWKESRVMTLCTVDLGGACTCSGITSLTLTCWLF